MLQIARREHERREVELVMLASVFDRIDNIVINMREYIATHGVTWQPPKKGSISARIRQMQEMYEQADRESAAEIDS